MFFVPNTTATIRRGTVELPNGDSDNSGKVVGFRVPILIEEYDVEVTDSETRSNVVIRKVRATVNPDNGIRKGDRVVDDATGYWYDVTGIANTIRNPLIPIPLKLFLQRSE